MKRGLVVLDPDEIPPAHWRGRVAALQRRLAAAGVDIALVYGDVSRSDDIAYLTNLCIYWNEGVLAIPSAGDPALLTKLSPRVHPWMRRTSTITDVRSGRSFRQLVAGYLGEPQDGPARTVGLVDAPLWPAAVIDEIATEIASVPGRRLRHLGAVVREQRLVPSAEELALLRRGAAILTAAADQAARPGLAAPERVAVVERELRGAGFLDVLARSGRTADGVASLQVTGQYRNGWVHASRLLDGGADGGPGGGADSGADRGAGGAPGWPAAMRRALGAAIRAAAAGVPAAHLTAAARPALGSLPAGAVSHIRWVNQADMATGGEYADYPPGLEMADGSVVVITVEAEFADGQTAAVADTVLVRTGGAEPLAGRA